MKTKAEPVYVYTVGVSCAKMREKVSDYIVDKLKPGTILDLGCGAGAYGMAIKARDPNITMIGLDGCMKYLTSVYALKCYKARIHCLIEDFLKGLIEVSRYLTLFMDGPEHFEKETAIEILNQLSDVIVSTPLFDYEQGIVEGNKLEIHRCFFTEEEINALGYKTLYKVKYDKRGDIGAFTKFDGAQWVM